MRKLYQVVSTVVEANSSYCIENSMYIGFNYKEAEENYQSEKMFNKREKKDYPSRRRFIVELRAYEVENDFDVEDSEAMENLLCYGDYKSYKQFEN